MSYSHKGIYAIHTPSIIDGCTVIKKNKSSSSLFSFSRSLPDKRYDPLCSFFSLSLRFVYNE